MPEWTEDQWNDIMEYMSTLGRFMHEFAKLEAALQVVLRFVAGTDEAVSRAIFSGTRADQAVSFIRRVHEAKGKPNDEVLERAFSQIAVINTSRNAIVHYGAQLSPGEFLITNRRVAHSERALKEFRISPKILHDLTGDTIAAKNHLELYLAEHIPHFIQENMLPSYREILQRAWRYKPL